MKSISTQAIIEGIRSKKDRSLGLSISTPELSTQEKALFMEIQGINVELIIKPTDIERYEEYQIDTDLNQKTQSERIRNVLFILWKQDPQGEFPEFYKQKTEKYIEWLKSKIIE